MKNLMFFLVVATGFLLLTATSCTKDKSTTFVTYKKYSPIYKTLAEMNEASKVLGAQSMKKTGKIFVYGDYLFINEVREGLHIIDNSNPYSPSTVAFISVPGNVDMAVKGNLLFLDSYFDLLTFDISDPASPKAVGRTENAFPQEKYRFVQAENAYIVGQLEEEVTEEVDSERADWLKRNDYSVFQNANGSGGAGGGGSSGPITVAGSMASMVIIGDNLYIINQKKVLLFSTNETPSELGGFNVAFGIETLFPYQDKLFIGSRSGMYIYDNSDPLNPTRLSTFMHMSSCDPVFVKDDIAYVTLRDGTPCQGAQNQLDVIDVSDILHPKLLKTYPMYNPHGLSVDDDQLYLCDGSDGLKVFGVSDLYNITANKKFEYNGMEAFDVIRMPNKELLIVIAKNGLFQFDLSGEIKLISQLSTNH